MPASEPSNRGDYLHTNTYIQARCSFSSAPASIDSTLFFYYFFAGVTLRQSTWLSYGAAERHECIAPELEKNEWRGSGNGMCTALAKKGEEAAVWEVCMGRDTYICTWYVERGHIYHSPQRCQSLFSSFDSTSPLPLSFGDRLNKVNLRAHTNTSGFHLCSDGTSARGSITTSTCTHMTHVFLRTLSVPAKPPSPLESFIFLSAYCMLPSLLPLSWGEHENEGVEACR